LAEHHGTPLSTAPSPNLFFSALVRRTRRLRFGPMAYLLPMYDPIRLIEEICVLDQWSGGRLELGLGRPASPHEAALYGLDMTEARGVAHEAIRVITSGLATGAVDFEGRHYRFKGVKLYHRPLQRPYPPLWYPTANLGSLPWIAEHGFSTLLLFLFASPAEVGAQLRLYRQGLAEHAGRPHRLNGHVAEPHGGFGIQIYVADSDAEARQVAREAHAVFFENFNHLWAEHGDLTRHAARADFETFVHQGLLACGSPDTVRALLQEYLDATGADYLAGVFGALGALIALRHAERTGQGQAEAAVIAVPGLPRALRVFLDQPVQQVVLELFRVGVVALRRGGIGLRSFRSARGSLRAAGSVLRRKRSTS
jgi:alkanesulfonate monooxygenase SsuD/methylene tetrahydromethanopterin reductase-like flavin-dependent oxidoreductase (luciferase family)